MRRLLPILLLLSLSCSDSDLQKVGKSLVVASKAIATVEDSTIQAEAQGLLSEAQARGIIEICVRASLAGKQAVQVTRTISTLDPGSREQLLLILKPVIAAIQTSINQDIITIPDIQTRQNVQLGLTAVQTAINTAIVIIAAGG